MISHAISQNYEINVLAWWFGLTGGGAWMFVGLLYSDVALFMRKKYSKSRQNDISELKATQQKSDDLRFQLDQQARVLDITLSSISDFAYIFNRDGRFVFVNQSLLNLWGLKLEEAGGKNFFELKYPDELAARLQQQIQTVFDPKDGLRDDSAYTSQTGVGGYYEYIFRPVLDREGNVELVAGSTRNITERKRTEADLRQSQERLGELAESLESQVQVRTRELEARNNDVLLQ